ncbi:MAG: ribosome maturation factor RimP [Pseudarcicella sp.]|nr:ribosome maturation factor RimP [Pseudarcicella sp.]MBP6410358.1 ribosome maturation factor RimP [Pseudarcicella sp.]
MIKEKIIELLQKYLEEGEIFIVEVNYHQSKIRTTLSILLDTDKGIQIEQCSKISRKLGNEIEELNLIDGAFYLEVSSPGLDQPLKLKRQFIKNIGRTLKVTRLNDTKEIIGVLGIATEDSITILKSTNKKLKKGELDADLEIPYLQIEKAKVQVSFS